MAPFTFLPVVLEIDLATVDPDSGGTCNGTIGTGELRVLGCINASGARVPIVPAKCFVSTYRANGGWVRIAGI